jgi:hypothetical protein
MIITREILTNILELARWAPSGDNSQPWTFHIAGNDIIHVTGIDNAEGDVYDFDGRPTLLTLGFLLETIAVAASRFAARAEWTYRSDAPHVHNITVTIRPVAALPSDPLLKFVETRSVARGRYQRTRLTRVQRTALEAALGKDLELHWFETFAEKRQITRINMRATYIRLSIPEAFSVHQRILDWRRVQSPDGVPAKAIGLDPMTLASMKWVMKSWSRAHFMNRFAGGTVVPLLEMDLLPGLFCGAHFMVFERNPRTDLALPEQLIMIGRSLQRMWLTATSLGLVMQPSLAPLCFAYYATQERAFTGDAGMRAQAQTLREELDILKRDAGRTELAFMGRIGAPLSNVQGPRSVRKSLAEMLRESESVDSARVESRHAG